MIDRLSEPDPPRTVKGEIIDILTVAQRPVTIRGVLERLRIGTAREAKLTLAALVDQGEVVTVEVHGRPDCVTLKSKPSICEGWASKRDRADGIKKAILAYLDACPRTRGEISSHLRVTPTTVTKYVVELEREGLAQRLGMVRVPGESQLQMMIKKVTHE